jgi:signal recognition particle subunit SEC65
MKPIVIKIFCALLFAPFSVFSQNKLKANISNGEQKAIAYASVALKGTSLGTISNPNGNFELALPSDDTKQQIVISCIGYKSQAFAVDSLLKIQKKGGTPKLYLNKHSYQLQEITVGKQEILKDAKQIFANAINELPKLLGDQPHIGKYYFRQSHKLDTSINRLIEAAVSIYDPAKNITDCKFNIDQLKSSLDNRTIDYDMLLKSYLYARKKNYHQGDSKIKSNSSYKDTLIQKYLLKDLDNSKASFSKFFITTNMIRGIQKGKRKKSLRINPHFKNGRPIITDSFIKEHSFKLDTILLLNNEAVYKIKILPNKKYPKIKFQEGGLIPIGRAYIRVKDYAILDFDYGYIQNPNHKHYIPRSGYYFHLKIKLTEFNKKLYLSYLYSNRFDYNSEISRKRRVIQELSLSKIINNQDTISKQLNTLNWKGDIYEKLPYHKEFWDNYTIMLPTAEQKRLKKNLKQELLKK